jgi:hypothetical protein
MKMNNKTHIEKRYSTQQQTTEYCKKDGDYLEAGSHRIQRERIDLHKIKNQIKEGVSLSEVFDSYNIQNNSQIKVIETMLLIANQNYATYCHPKLRYLLLTKTTLLIANQNYTTYC